MTAPPAIVGAPTSDVAFIGRTTSGAVLVPTVVESPKEFANAFGTTRAAGHLAEAVRAFFANGGRRATIVRVPPGRAPLADGRSRTAAALAVLETTNVLVLPGETARAPLAEARAWAEAHGAMLLVELPSRCATVADVQAWDATVGASLRSPFVAAYHPWLVEPDAARPGTVRSVPPAGAVAGVYVRTDEQRGVQHAPAGTSATINGGVSLTHAFTDDDSAAFAALGINVLRAFAGRAQPVVWGARTRQRGDYTYVPVRRLVTYIEQSLTAGLAWTAFEPNGDALWGRVRGSAENFLLQLWRDGALLGSKPDGAFFVKCDRTTMTQDDIDNGRLVALVGVAPVRPAEFVIVRIGGWACRDC